jgi:hypothetical protein
MNAQKREALEKTGWHVGDAAEFLGLSPAEVERIELELAHLNADAARARDAEPQPDATD